MKKVISTPHAPAAIGPYSQAIDTGDLIFLSGQIPLVPETGKLLEGDIRMQTGQVMKNIGAILEAAGLHYGHVVKCTCFLADMDDFKAMNEVYGTFFTAEPPARAAFQVAKLPLGAKVEIEAIAVRKIGKRKKATGIPAAFFLFIYKRQPYNCLPASIYSE